MYYHGQTQKSIYYWSNYRIIENSVSKVFSPSAKFYMIITTKMAPKPYTKMLVSKISKHWYQKSSYCNSSYRYISIENIEPANHNELKKNLIRYWTSTSVNSHKNNQVLSIGAVHKFTDAKRSQNTSLWGFCFLWCFRLNWFHSRITLHLKKPKTCFENVSNILPVYTILRFHFSQAKNVRR